MVNSIKRTTADTATGLNLLECLSVLQLFIIRMHGKPWVTLTSMTVKILFLETNSNYYQNRIPGNGDNNVKDRNDPLYILNIPGS